MTRRSGGLLLGAAVVSTVACTAILGVRDVPNPEDASTDDAQEDASDGASDAGDGASEAAQGDASDGASDAGDGASEVGVALLDGQAPDGGCAAGFVACGGGHVCCGSGTTCAVDAGRGVCTCNALTPCPNGNNTCSAASTWYPDTDNDGFGTSADSAAAVLSCSKPDGGYANTNTDCCDIDPNAYPNEPNYYSSADLCGSFDYNCDGVPEQRVNGPSGCDVVNCVLTADGGCVNDAALPSGCSGFGSVGTADCGVVFYGTSHSCALYSPGMCYAPGSAGPAGTQACR
jgi:hypothetical protein